MAPQKSAIAREFAPGTLLFEEADPGDRMYVIRSGRVKIFREHGGKELVLAFLEAGDFLGEMALLEGLPRSASAMVVEPSVLIEVDSATFEEMIRRNIEIAVRIMRRLSGRVRALDGRLEKLMVESSLMRALEVLRWLIPQGIIDEGWIRVRGIGPHFDIASQAGIPESQAKSVLRRLESAGCLRFDQEDILIAEKAVLDNYASYLELKREYEPVVAITNAGDPEAAQKRALRRLMGALQLDEQQIHAQQKKLVGKYERYVDLKSRFRALDALDDE